MSVGISKRATYVPINIVLITDTGNFFKLWAPLVPSHSGI